LNPVALGVVTAAAVQMAAAELVVRRVWTGRCSFRHGATLMLATIALAAGLIATPPAVRRRAVSHWDGVAGTASAPTSNRPSRVSGRCW
jgi:hypothetical protein